MSVRAAKFTDIIGLVALMERAHKASRFAEYPFDREDAKQLWVRSIQRHGHKNYGGSLALVAERDGEIKGMMIGFLDQVYPAVRALRCTDLMFYVEDGAKQGDAVRLIQRVIAWGQSNPKVAEIVMGVNDTMGPFDRVVRLYEAMGFEACGGMFRFSKEVAQCRAS